jgi:hypothetical protein
VIRTLIIYDGVEYTITTEGPEAVRDRIEEVLRREPLMWLEANRGEGRLTPSFLMVTSATPIAIVSERSNAESDPHTVRIAPSESVADAVED